MQVGQSLDSVGKGLVVDLRVFCPQAVADGAVGYGGEFEDSCHTPILISNKDINDYNRYY